MFKVEAMIASERIRGVLAPVVTAERKNGATGRSDIEGKAVR